MSFIMPPSAVTSTSSIIIILTLVHPFATSWPSSPKGDARTLRIHLSVSYSMISILRIGSLRSPPPIRAAPDCPLCRGQNKTPRNTLFIRDSTVSTGYSATVEVLHRTSTVLHTSRGRKPSTRPGGVSRSRTEPLAPRAKGPAAPSTLAAKPRQPSGILASTDPVPIPTAPRAPHHPLNPLAKRPFPFFSSMI